MEYGLRYPSSGRERRVLLTFPGESVPIVVPAPAPAAPVPVPSAPVPAGVPVPA